MGSYLKVELLHSAIARDQRQKDTLRGLGLRHRHQQRILKDTPAIRGMIQKVFDLVRWESAANDKLSLFPKVETYRLGAIVAAPPQKIKTAARAVEKEGAEEKTPKVKKAAKAQASHATHKTSTAKAALKKKKG